MSTQQLVFSRDLTFHITCPHCASQYEFDRKVEAKRDGENAAQPTQEMIDSAAEELDALEQSHGDAVVKCPACKKLGPGMMRRHLMHGGFIAGWIVLCLIGARVVTWVADATGSLF